MADSVHMSLDEIIKQNKQSRVSRARGRGGGNTVNRGNNRGRGRGTGGLRGRGRGRGRGRSQSRAGTPGGRQSRSASRGPRGRSQSQNRSQSRTRSRSRQRRRSVSQSRSASRSRSQIRMTPKGRAGLEEQQISMPGLVRGNFNRGRWQNRLRRSNSIPNLRGGIHNRLGVNTFRGGANIRRPLAVAKRGISKRGRGLSTGNRFSSIGLRSDQILKEQRLNLRNHNNIIQSQTFTRSRRNSFNASQLTVSVANDFIKRRRNSAGNAGYLNKQSLKQLNSQYGGYSNRRGPGSVKSMGSNKSNRSTRSNGSNVSRRSMRSRGRGRGANRGVGRNFVNKQILNPKLQKEIAAIQGRTPGTNNAIASNEPPSGVNFTPTPASTSQTLHQRFASAT